MHLTKIAMFAACCLALAAGLTLASQQMAPVDPTPAPAVGTQAPNFTLQANDKSMISLADYRGKWVVLYFYPADFTSGCTIEAHNFQQDLDKYKAMNAVILGVSVQDVASHQSFCDKEGLHFHLLADTQHKVSEMYGSYGGKYAQRHTFLIDPSGKIVQEWMSVKPQVHSAEVLAALKTAQSSSGD